MKKKKLKIATGLSLALLAMSLAACDVTSTPATNTTDETKDVTPSDTTGDTDKKDDTKDTTGDTSSTDTTGNTDKKNDTTSTDTPSENTTPSTSDELTITSVNGVNEGVVVILPNTIKAASYRVSYSLANENNYKLIDSELIRNEGSSVRADILGLKASTYDIKVEANNQTKIIEDIKTYESDRSGYAHYNYDSGVGAYNDDGTLKDGTVVVYVTNETKNTVKATIAGTEYTGLSAIIQAQTNSNVPLNIRVLDEIQAATWNNLTVSSYSAATTTTVKGANNKYLELKGYTEEEIIQGGFNTLNESKYTKLNGLTNKIKYDSSKNEFDSYYNMLDVTDCKNITIEGVGESAGLFQWGFTFRRCTGVEVKNLTFKDAPEDSCSAEASDDSTTVAGFTTGHIWIHNNTFYKGKNYWDVCSEQDKGDGDGTVDFKKLANVTVSYNHFIQNHKTGLVGGSDTQHTANLTFHHNFYDNCQSRLPFARQANMHMYNNYYYKSTGNNMQIYAGAYAFIENCYFESVKSPFTLRTSDGKTPAVKSYNNTFNNCNSTGATIVTDRAATVANDCLYGNTFDTNNSIFYYDSANNKSSVAILNETDEVPAIVKEYAGAGANYYKSILKYVNSDVTKYTVTLMNGSDVFASIKVIENNKITEPSTYPTSTSGVFDCWVDENGNEFNFDTVITADTTLYAKFSTNPTYEALATSANNVMAYDFNDTTADEILTQFTDHTTKGIFGGTNGTDYSIAHAKYTGTSIQTVDNDASKAAYIYTSTGTEYTSGVVKGWVELTLTKNKGSKWALVTFTDSTNTPVFTLGVNSSSCFSYSVGTTKIESGTTLITTPVAAGNVYKIYYEFDLDNGTTTIIINNTVYLNSEKTDVSKFSGFYTMTNGTGTGDKARVVTLDNIAIVKE